MNHLYNQIILYGDSLTQQSHNKSGWGAELQSSYIRKLDVLNRGFSGYNTELAKHLLPHLLPKKNNLIQNPKVFLLTIFFGANDAAIPPSVQHVTLERYEENLRQMIDIIKNPDSPYHSPETRILLITPPPLDEESRKKHSGVCDRKFEITAKYAQTCVDLANKLNVPVLNLWKLFNDKVASTNVTLNDFLSDGVHLSALGNETLFHGLLDTIRENWPELNPDNLKPLTPLWTELNHDINLEQQLNSLESNITNQLKKI
ncbi:SGNH hydrolase-type esterase domain-containing protein [Glomus cerebriforme]|uniref:SGNH hydrolase-type esterase domain-containing protein n=1 Tax=Glomus cerebriforme TaxID=658196 RepID=A0A397TLY6_9GLOM|nr:SGNH hydrolase-type esterase domain-containing protein [Glomus cerebriforme]